MPVIPGRHKTTPLTRERRQRMLEQLTERSAVPPRQGC